MAILLHITLCVSFPAVTEASIFACGSGRERENPARDLAEGLQEVNVELKGLPEVRDHISTAYFAQTHAGHYSPYSERRWQA